MDFKHCKVIQKFILNFRGEKNHELEPAINHGLKFCGTVVCCVRERDEDTKGPASWSGFDPG